MKNAPSRLVLCALGGVLGSVAIRIWYDPNHATPSVPASEVVPAVTADTVFEASQATRGIDDSPATNPVAQLNVAFTIIEITQRRAEIDRILCEWAWTEPDAVFAWLESADDPTLSYASNVLEILSLSDPERVVRLSRRLNRGYQFSEVVTRAIGELAERDHYAVISQLDDLPPGEEYRAWRQGIANAYVARDPIGALSWAQSLQPASPETVSDVMSAICDQDLELSFELAISSIAAGNTIGMNARSWMTRDDASDSATMARIGERIATLPSEQAALLIGRFGEVWSIVAPEDALQWALNHWSVGKGMIPTVAINMGRVDTEQTTTIAGLLPPDNREQWLRARVALTALEMMGSDPAAVPKYLTQFEQEPFYDDLIDSLARNFASSPYRILSPGDLQKAIQSLPDGELRNAIQSAVEADGL